jgi:hypothetical protein
MSTELKVTRPPSEDDCRARVVLLKQAARYADAGEEHGRLLGAVSHASHTTMQRERLFIAYRAARDVLVDADECGVVLDSAEQSLAESTCRLIFGEAAYRLAQHHLALDTPLAS